VAAVAAAATWGQPFVACAEKVCRGGSSGSGILGSGRDRGSVDSGGTAIAMAMAQTQQQWWQQWWQARMWAGGMGGKMLFMETGGHQGVYTTIKWLDMG
jgi:hypothetical protein